MEPKPVNRHYEQYNITTYKSGSRVRVVPVAPGDDLDKWEFEASDGGLVLRKHIGGVRYNAKHTTPGAVPVVVAKALESEGYEIEHPTNRYMWVPNPDADNDKYGAQIPTDSDHNPEWEDVSEHTAEWARPVVEG